MILASPAKNASKPERYRGRLTQTQFQLRLLEKKGRNRMLSRLGRLVADHEELLYVGVAFGAGTVAAGVILILVNIL